MDRVPITRKGLEKLKSELDHLQKVERPQNIRAIEEARAHGDISENAEYHAAKERQSFLDGKITELESVIGRSEIIEVDDSPTDRVVFGRTVVLYNVNTDEETSYQLLGPYESDPEAGIEFAKAVKKRHPDIPVLLQSNNQQYEKRAFEVGASFLLKNSPTLLNELQKFMIQNFSFGDFVFCLPDGSEIDRARDVFDGSVRRSHLALKVRQVGVNRPLRFLADCVESRIDHSISA